MNAPASWAVLPIRPIRKLLVADRGDIASRVLRAAAELGIRTVAIDAGLDIEDIIAIAREHGVDAIHPGDGCLSENADFAEACAANCIAFIGPSPTLMRTLGSSEGARGAALRAGVPVLPAGGLEKMVHRAQRVEVPILGDLYGNRVHLSAPCVHEAAGAALCGAALRLAEEVDYTHAGTVEFLMDADSGEFYFTRLRLRIGAEHMVTGQMSDIDIVKAQIRISEGARVGGAELSACVQQIPIGKQA